MNPGLFPWAIGAHTPLAWRSRSLAVHSLADPIAWRSWAVSP